MKIGKLSLKNRTILIVAIALIISSAFSILISAFIRQFDNTFKDENESYLSEISGYIASNLQTCVLDIQKGLETAAFIVPNIENTNERKEYMSFIAQEYSFEYVGVANENGDLTTNLSFENKNILEEEYFKSSMKGESLATYFPLKIFPNRAISGLLFSVPTYHSASMDGDPIGVVVGMLDIKHLAQFIDFSAEQGKGTTYIIDKQGEIILNTSKIDYSNFFMALKNSKFQNGYSLETMMDDISLDKNGFSFFSDFGVQKYLYYQKLGIDDWIVVNVISKSVITAKTTNLITQVTFLAIAILVVFSAVLFFSVYYYGKSNIHRKAAESKSAFLANMSHEIRTPMNAIVGISEILLREKLSFQQKNYVLSIINAGNGLLTIINDILDISKMESGKFAIVNEEYELESLIFDVISIISIRIGEKPIEFLVELDPKLPKKVVGDIIRVKQVLLNIIGNAVKFTKSGYIKFGINANVQNGEIELVMPIEDTGCGISKKDIEKLFVTFNQVDTHKNRNIEGTGLGLVISKRLCEMMGGGISVSSEYGKGSVFTIKVKQIVSGVEQLITLDSKISSKMLLYEPTPILREFYTSCLDKMSICYDLAESYDDFLPLLTNEEYSHVLCSSEIMRRCIADSNCCARVHFVALLKLKEQSHIEDYGQYIYTPLFNIQLATIVNNNNKPLIMNSRKSGIDLLSIQPMPFAKVLIVDDNEVNLQVAGGLMRPYYMQIDYALSGEKAIGMLKEKNYDLIFMDHMMPDMDGVEATKIIRSLNDPIKSKTVIVALTANVTQVAKDTFIKAGFDDFLAKPIETVVLHSILKKWLKSINDERTANNPELADEYEKRILIEASGVDENDVNFGGKIDFKTGMEKLGDKKVYCEILATYYRSATEKIAVLQQLLDTDIKNFTIEIHGLKGASAGINIEFIAKLAAQLEELGKEEDVGKLYELLPMFIEELKKALDEISSFLSLNDKISNTEKCEVVKVADKKINIQLLDSLKQNFLDFNTETLKVQFAELKDCAIGEMENNLINSLYECYIAYDFDNPIKLIDEYKNSLV